VGEGGGVVGHHKFVGTVSLEDADDDFKAHL
jgi:hypothetical protein